MQHRQLRGHQRAEPAVPGRRAAVSEAEPAYFYQHAATDQGARSQNNQNPECDSGLALSQNVQKKKEKEVRLKPVATQVEQGAQGLLGGDRQRRHQRVPGAQAPRGVPQRGHDAARAGEQERLKQTPDSQKTECFTRLLHSEKQKG